MSKPGKPAAHVASEEKEKIWKGDFVDVFSLIRAKRRERGEKESKDSKDKKPRVEECIYGCLDSMHI